MTFDIKSIQISPEQQERNNLRNAHEQELKEKELNKVIKERAGQTKITSISLSKEFRNFMEDYNISPTEAVRKGVAIILHERGLPQYKSQLNAERFKALQEMLKIEKMVDLPEKLKQAEILLKEIRNALI